MQHLLDFIQEHTFEEQLYFVAQCRSGPLEVLWRRSQHPEHWQVRWQTSEAAWELVPRAELMRELEARHADMAGVKSELHSMLAGQIAFADMVLRDANQQLGRDLVQRFVIGHQSFIRDLQTAVEMLTDRPTMAVVRGGGEQTVLRTGHLSLVR